jgi:hypothetical protein
MPTGARWTSDNLTDGAPLGPGRRPRLLLLCDFRPYEAATVLDHIEAIRRWSRYEVFVLPMFGDLPDEVDLDAFDGLIIHYNLVMSNQAYLSPLARWRINRFSGVKAAFIQDEYRFVNRTIGVMRTLGINVLFTCVPEDQVGLVYPDTALPEIKRKVTVLTGYVPQQLLGPPVRPYDDRPIDVGYRGRRLPAWLGRLAQEKAMIADRFAADAAVYGLTADISCNEHDRLYGQAWVNFISRSKATLGVESGASVFDFDGSIEQAVRAYQSAHPGASFEELDRRFLADVDGHIRLNQISPRCFEAAALGTLMVLYPGSYSGVLEPWRHYVPLHRDHSNMAEVAQAIRDRATWERITADARRDVALNPRYSFRAMVETVDTGLDLQLPAHRDVHPGAFERVASRNFAGMATTRLHALGLPPAINRARLVARRATRAFVPSPMAISASPRRAAGAQHFLRLLIGYTRSLTYWALRPHRLPPTLLVSHRGLLLKELSELARLQELGSRAMRARTESPFVLLVGEGTAELRIVLRMDVPATASPLTADPPDLSDVSAISLDLSDEWLVPTGVGDASGRRLEALSAVMQARPDVGRRLLAGWQPWCQYALLRRPQAVADVA